MAVKGFQVHGLFGSYIRFKRFTTGGVEFPWFDLGVIDPVSPNVQSETAVLEDPRSGIRREVDKVLTKVTESSDVKLSNLNMDNLALLWLSSQPTEVTQAAGLHTYAAAKVFPGRLLELRGNDGERLVKVKRIVAMYEGSMTSATTLTSITVSSKTLKFSANPTLSPGDLIVLPGTGINAANAGTLKVVTSLGSGTYDTVVESLPSDAVDQSSITGTWLKENAGTIYEAGVDYDDDDLSAGWAKAVNGGAFGDEGDPLVDDVTVITETEAISGKRLLKPQDIKGEIKGDAEIVWSSENNARRIVRRAQVSFAPNGSQFSATDFSNFSLSMTVLSDLTQDDPAGDAFAFEGDLPTETS